MLKKILVATDGSKSAAQTIDKAEFLAKNSGADLTIVTVIPEPSYYRHNQVDFPYGSDLIAANEERANEVLEDAKKSVNIPGKLETLVLVGNSAKKIIEAADERDVDLIVVGNRGLGAFSRTLLGSVSNKVINHTDRSVLVVKGDIDWDDED